MSAPASLPADFFDQKDTAPQTLPADFFDKQAARKMPPQTLNGVPIDSPEAAAMVEKFDHLVPKDAGEWLTSATKFLKGAIVNPVVGVGEMAAKALSDGMTPTGLLNGGPAGALGRMIAESHIHTGQKAVEAFRKGNYSEAAGNALATGGSVVTTAAPR